MYVKYYSLLMTWSKAVLVILISVEYIVSLAVVGGYHVGEALLMQQGRCVCDCCECVKAFTQTDAFTSAPP